MKKITVFGIPNCDTTKKTLHLLTAHEKPFSFHDYKQQGISREKLESWCSKLGWQNVLNKKSTTWRELTPADQDAVTNQETAIQLMEQKNSLIKRPLIEIDDEPVIIGYKEATITQAATS